jgi:hypothetical protein
MIRYTRPQGRVAASGNTGNQYYFSAITVDSDGAFETVTDRATWSSSNESVARPLPPRNEASFVAVGPGTANAIVRFAGLEAVAPMVFVDPALLNAYPRLDLIDGRPVQAWFREGSATNQVRNVSSSTSWSSSDTRVATISASGAITWVGVGTTVISGTFNGHTDWYWLSVGPPFP